MAQCVDTHGELSRQAQVARALGSPFVAAVLEAGERQLAHAPRTAALIAQWPGDPAAAALAMRFNAALHALARRGRPPALLALYTGQHRDFDGAIGAALHDGDRFVARWMRDPPQTNEVRRAAAILAALMVLSGETGLPCELFELGSSAGLNLNLARYAYDLGGVAAGDPASPVRIAPQWRGTPAPHAPVELVATRGVDLHPLDPQCAPTRERLLSYIWADEPDRAARLEQALDLARRHPPRVDRANAADWLAKRLAEPQRDGIARAVVHSMVLQYLNPKERAAVIGAISDAGAGATARRPLAWIAFEWSADRREVRLTLTTWPGGVTRLLALCHPYGAWIDWQA